MINDESRRVINNMMLNATNYKKQSAQLSQAKVLLKELLKFHEEGEDGYPIPRELWSKEYLFAVESAESFLRITS